MHYIYDKLSKIFGKDSRIGVLGLGINGLSTANILSQSGFEVFACDDNPSKVNQADPKVCASLSKDFDLSKIDVLITSPGVYQLWPKMNPIIAKAKLMGIPIFCDVDLLYYIFDDAFYIAITGTNGKSTTTALIGHVLKNQGVNVYVGGNLGTPALQLALDAIDSKQSNPVFVLEMSSYQLEKIIAMSADIALLINITPDHLDYHGGMAGYIAAKQKIFRRLFKKQIAILGIDENTQDMLPYLKKDEEREIISFDNKKNLPIAINNDKYLGGKHNLENAWAAYLVLKAYGISDEAISQGFNSFRGLPHRQEFVTSFRGVDIINDSKATNINSVICAFERYDYDQMYVIMGGKSKGESFESIKNYASRIKKIFAIGETALQISKELGGVIDVVNSGNLTDAVKGAIESVESATNDSRCAIVLEPACPSFDQFDHFMQRGEVFCEMVRELVK